jgi:hypothetical protein
MQRIVSISVSNRRLVSALAVGIMLAAALLIQIAGIRQAGASVKVAAAPCTAARIGFLTPQPLPPGSTVYINQLSTGCTSPEYRLWLLAPGSSTWAAKTLYNSSPTYSWVTTGAKQGVWQIALWARQAGSGARYQAWSTRTFSLVVSYCTSADMSPVPPVSGTGPYVITATATGCGTPLFEWWEMAPGRTTWTMVQSYVAGGTQSQIFNWSNWAPGGGYRFSVWAKEQESARRYDTYAIFTVWP